MFRLLTRTLLNARWYPSRSLSTANGHVNVKIIDRDKKLFEVKAKVGTNMLDVILDNKIDVDGFGACEGTLACSTCHVILNSENYKTLPEPVDEENDMLDLAFGLTPTSRLACQIIVEPRMKDWVFVVPNVNSCLGEETPFSLFNYSRMSTINGDQDQKIQIEFMSSICLLTLAKCSPYVSAK